jgi:DnaD/phage-associated family protein
MFNRGLKNAEKVKGDKTVYRWLELLEKGEYLTIEKTNKFSVVTIAKWRDYQLDGSENDHQNDQQMTNKRPSNDHQMTTNKNVKEGIKNVEELKTEEIESGEDDFFDPLPLPGLEKSLAVQFYSKNFTWNVPPHIVTKINDWAETMPESVIVKAMEIGVENDSKTWSYVNKTLVNWYDSGVRTLEQAEAAIAEFKAARQQQAAGKQGNNGRSGKGYSGKQSLPIAPDGPKEDPQYTPEQIEKFKAMAEKFKKDEGGPK